MSRKTTKKKNLVHKGLRCAISSFSQVLSNPSQFLVTISPQPLRTTLQDSFLRVLSPVTTPTPSPIIFRGSHRRFLFLGRTCTLISDDKKIFRTRGPKKGVSGSPSPSTLLTFSSSPSLLFNFLGGLGGHTPRFTIISLLTCAP